MDSVMKDTLDRLRKITADCRPDMHEPDNFDISAKVEGTMLDNAGLKGELVVTIIQSEWDEKLGRDVRRHERLNLATLIALARMAGSGDD